MKPTRNSVPTSTSGSGTLKGRSGRVVVPSSPGRKMPVSAGDLRTASPAKKSSMTLNSSSWPNATPGLGGGAIPSSSSMKPRNGASPRALQRPVVNNAPASARNSRTFTSSYYQQNIQGGNSEPGSFHHELSPGARMPRGADAAAGTPPNALHILGHGANLSPPTSRRPSLESLEQPPQQAPQPQAQALPAYLTTHRRPSKLIATPPPRPTSATLAHAGATVRAVSEPVYFVGGAVVNPNLPIAPAVQQEVRSVPAREEAPAATTRPRAGPQVEVLAVTPVTAADGSKADPRRVAAQEPDPNSPPMPTFETSVSVSNSRKEEQEGGAATANAACMRTLRRLYGTTPQDVPPNKAVEGAFASLTPQNAAQEILPELRNAESRATELATVRRLIDWTVEIPTAATIPPPAITFFNSNGEPATQTTLLSFELDSHTQELVRTSAHKAPEVRVSSGKRVPTGRAATRPAAAEPERHHDDDDDAGSLITCLDDGRYRVRRVVGLLRGLSEKVGLDRVMEYQVRSATQDMFLSAPYVDAEAGDLVLHLNTSLQGTIRLTIHGYDCASVDAATGEVQESSNTLSCVIKVDSKPGHGGPAAASAAARHTAAGAVTSAAQTANPSPTDKLDINGGEGLQLANFDVNTSQSEGMLSPLPLSGAPATAVAASAGGGSAESRTVLGTTTSSSFTFPLTNPHNLRYDVYRQTAFDFVITRNRAEYKRQQQKQREAAAAAARERESSYKSHEDPSCSSSGVLSVISDPQLHPAAVPPTSVDSPGKTKAAASLEAKANLTDLERADMELRESAHRAPWFLLGSLQHPISHFRLTSWQDRFTQLFRSEADKELYRADQRQMVKKEARREVREVLTAQGRNHSTSSNSYSRRSMHGRASLADVAIVLSVNATGGTTDTSLDKLRRLVLCLLLEENRTSRQLFLDTQEICNCYVRTAYRQSMSSSGGSREALQWRAAAVLSTQVHTDKRNASPLRPGSGGLGVANANPSVAPLGEREREATLQLLEALTVAMIASFYIGAYAQGAQFALQRVHLLCVLERDTTATVNEAQRDLAELYLWHGDANRAAQVAEDVLLLSQELNGPDSPETVEATLLVYWAALSRGRVERVLEALTALYDFSKRLSNNLAPYLRAQIHIAVAYARPNVGNYHLDQQGFTSENVVAELNRALTLLRGDGDLAEMDRSFSTMLPSQHNLSALQGGGSRVKSVQTQKAQRSEKRQRWNLLSFVGAMLIQNGETEKGIKVIEDVVQELVLGQHHFVERNHRSEIASILWVSIALWRCWAYPHELHQTQQMLRRMVERLLQVEGPMHPITCVAHIVTAYALRYVPHSHALSLLSRAMGYLQRNLSARAPMLLTGHRVACILYTIGWRWHNALDHAYSAISVAALSNSTEELLVLLDEDLLGSLLRVPQTSVIRLDTAGVRQRLLKRVENMAHGYGQSHPRLMVPLMTLADFYYLMGSYDEALSAAQRAARIADPKGALFVSHAVLRPASQLPTAAEVEQRDRLVQTAVATRDAQLQLAQILYSMAAIMEAKGDVGDAQDCYSRCLALLEVMQVDGCLAAIRVKLAIAQLHHSCGEYGDALGWARLAVADVLANYKGWTQEIVSAKTTLAAIEQTLYEQEGTYVAVNTFKAYSEARHEKQQQQQQKGGEDKGARAPSPLRIEKFIELL